MWWLDPGKEVLNVLFNRILAPYVMNLDMNQVNYGIGQGQLTLRKLRLKRGALDKFRLPVDVLEGHLGKFTLSLHWMNLGNQPVEILIEDVYLLVVPSVQTTYNAKEEEERSQAAKAERLESAELLHMQTDAEASSDKSQQPQGLWESLTAKIINNLQITVKNIHIRYEDRLSVPGHPFAAGLTLAEFTAVSVNDKWQPAFIESTAGAIHKLGKLQSLAIYFNTDSSSMADLPYSEFVEKFHQMITADGQHQYILKPVSGEGRIIVNRRADKEHPQFDVQLLFNEIGVALDDHQYRDIISLVDMYHVYVRQHQYKKFRPNDEEFTANAARARLKFATTAIFEGVRDRNRKWSWAFFAERRDDRNKYVSLFQKKTLNTLGADDVKQLAELEKKLSYEDIRFYRSIARSRLRKDTELRKRLEAEKTKQQTTRQGWTGWLWGSSSASSSSTDPAFGGPMTEEQKKQLYDVLDYDEKAAFIESLQAPRDSIKARFTAQLETGSFSLKNNHGSHSDEIIFVEFSVFKASFLQRPDNFEASASLRDFSVVDGTNPATAHKHIVQTKNTGGSAGQEDPLFFVKFDHHPLDERADDALTLRLRHLEIIYHKGYVEAIYKFFKPPESQLESVEALLNVASQTLEGISKETRAGLEFALQNHKTIDIQMDLSAPVIIIPEDVTTKACRHLIIDAGHFAIESQLADKEAIRLVQQKRNQIYNSEDYKQLQSLMYDKLIIKLRDAQFIIGNDLESCLQALTSQTPDALHLLERISLDFQVQNSIVPSNPNLPRFKISGKLPTLQVNLSDMKYKSLMRLIDVSIPNFGEPVKSNRPILESQSSNGGSFALAPTLFAQPSVEYHLDDDHDDHDDDEQEDTGKDEEFFEAEEGIPEKPLIQQHLFELDFQVDQLRALLSKTGSDGQERLLGEVLLEQFGLTLVLRKYDLEVGVNLESLSMDLVQHGRDERIKFISSESFDPTSTKGLLRVVYLRTQADSPNFSSRDGIEQVVEVHISTVLLRAAPEPVLTLYDFIMNTFVPANTVPPSEQSLTEAGNIDSTDARNDEGKIRVSVHFASVQVLLLNGGIPLATLSLSTAVVNILLRQGTMRVTGRLGNLALITESDTYPSLSSDFRHILSIEGDNFAEFSYQTFDSSENSYTGIKSSFNLATASVRIQFLEQPLHGIYLFLVKLARLKGLYDAATQAAVQKASEIERMQFEISVKSPIIVFPSDPNVSSDTLVLRLGEISARNTSQHLLNKISASLRGIQLVSNTYLYGQLSSLKIIDDIEINADVTQTSGIDRSKDTEFPDTQVAITISDIRIQLTQIQYGLLLNLSLSVAKVFAGAQDELDDTGLVVPPNVLPPADSSSEPSTVSLEPEVRVTSSAGVRTWTTVDLVMTVNTVKLHMYDQFAITEADFRTHGIVRFAISSSSVRMKMLSDGAVEAQLVLKSFTMSNTRPGNSKFREIIPAAEHDRNQFMILYTASGGSALAILTVDSPQVIFALDPVFALVDFFTAPFSHNRHEGEQPTSEVHATEASSVTSLDFRFDLHDVVVTVLEDDTNPSTQSIRLSISQVMLSRQGIMALTVNRLGMSLMHMGQASESVRFLDDVDLTLSLDNRSSSAQQLMSIEVNAKPIVFRASYRDIVLISTIVNKALEMSNRPAIDQSAKSQTPEVRTTGARTVHSGPKSSIPPIGRARVVTSKEQLKASFDGFRFVLIGDMHEQPMVHLRVKRFIIGAKDWSSELHATTTMSTQISYWNLTNSHWEPLIDPWTFTVSVAKSTPSSALDIKLSSRERLDLNLSTTFAELALTSLNMWSKDVDRVTSYARGTHAPYHICNRTGTSIFLWSDVDASNSKDRTGITILNDQTIDWRFDDWRTMREHMASAEQHNIGVQFVGKSWEQVRSIPVEREGEYVFPLRPRTERQNHRLLCEVKVVDNVKIVTLRSTFKVENLTLYPLEITLVDDSGHPIYSLEKIPPGRDFCLPIDAVAQTRIRIQPDQGFGYKWCTAIRWDELSAKTGFTIKCPHSDPREAAFRFQAWVHTDQDAPGSVSRHPRITLKLRAPFELENLLPYNLQYRVYDKNTDQNWKSFLRSGGVMPVHSVELGHLVLLNVDVEDTVFKPSDFAIVNTDGHGDFDIEHFLTLRDEIDRKLDLKLNYIRYPDSGGAFRVQIYAPYLVINKTGLPFGIRASRSSRVTSMQEVAGDTRPEMLSKPAPFMLSHQKENGHDFVLKIADSGWSKPFSVEAPVAEMELIVQTQKQKSDDIHVGISWSEGLGKYKLTKVITLAPRFFIKNNLTYPLSFREHGVAPRERSTVNPGERCPLMFIRPGQERLLTIALAGLNAQWSPPINMEDIGSIHLRLKTLEDTIRLMRADVQIALSSIFITFTETDDWPFVIENESDYTLKISQDDVNRDQRSGSSTPLYKVLPRSHSTYAWDFPAAREKTLLIDINGSRRRVDVMEIGDLMPFNFINDQRTKTVSLDVRADGQKQVLRVTNYNAEFSIYKPRHRGSTISSIARQEGTSTAEAFEAIAEEVTPSLTFSLDFAGIGLSLINKRLVEVIYASMDTLTLEYSNSEVAQTVTFSCGTLQVDNQLHDAIFPVIIQPTPIPKESKVVAALPTVQASVIWLKDQEHGVLFVKYCSILLQALTIEADEDLLFSIYDLTKIQGASWEDASQDVLIQQADGIPDPEETATGQDLYFEVLELQPIKISISFMRTERISSEEKLSLRNPLAVVINAITMAVGNINDAPLEMNALAIKDMRLTTPELQSRILYHYKQDVLRQLYRILGSADFIGNPVGLFTNVSSGVADIFYEPFNGVVMHGNKELGIGIAKGAASFVKKTVFGLSDSVTKFTSSVGKGLSAATFDSEYQARRRMTQRRNKPRHAIYGFAAGGEAFATSMASAMEGVLIKPIEGAESEGALGFFKGMGKGLVGAVTKPVVGVFDLASNVSEGIRNTTTVFDSPERDRARLPRLVPADGVLRPYSAREALGQYWMRDLNNGAYRQESYVAHYNSPGSDLVILLTASKILSFWSKRLKLEWELLLNHIQGVTVEDTGIRFAHKAGKAHDRFVFIPDKASQSWFFERVAGVVKNFNVRKRMDS